jgi:hypothetical protein
VKRWARALGVYAVLLVVAYGACFAFGGDDGQEVLRRTRESTERFREAGKDIQTLRISLTEACKQMAATQALAQNPDWSLLLAMVSNNLSGDVILERCFLAPVNSSEEDGRADGPDDGSDGGQVLYQRYILDLRGFSRTQTGVSQFVLRLERSKLFENVRLVKTSKTSFMDGEAISFRIECVLNGQGEPGQ